MLRLPRIIKFDFLCELIAWSSALGALTLGSAQPGKSTFDGAASKSYVVRVNPSANPVSNCNIWVPLCQAGSIVVDVNVTKTTQKAIMPCSHYLSAQSAFMEHVILDPSGWSTYDLYTRLWRSPECTSYAKYLQAKIPFQPLFASGRSIVSIPHLTYSDLAYPQQYCCGPSAIIINEVKVLYFPEKSLATCSSITGGPTTLGSKILDDLGDRKFLWAMPRDVAIPRKLTPVAALLPTTTPASRKSASNWDLKTSIPAAPADSGSPSLPVATNGPLVEPTKKFRGEIPEILKPVAALLPTKTSVSLKSASDRDQTPSISAAPADSGSPSLPVVTNRPLVKPPRIPGVLSPVLPTTASASLESASDRDLKISISAAPADSASPSLPLKSNKPHVKPSELRPTTNSRQTSFTLGHNSATGQVEPSPVHSEHRSSQKPSANLEYLSQPPLNELGQEPSSFLPAIRGQQKQDSPKRSGEQPAQVSPVDPNTKRVQVSSESQEHQQQTTQRKLEYQGSSVSNLGQASHLALSTNLVVPHLPETPVTIPGTVLSSLTSKTLVIANATIRLSQSVSSQPSSFFATSNKTTAVAGSAPFISFDTSTLNSARKAEANTFFGTPGSLRYMRVMHTSTKKGVFLPTANTGTSTSLSHSNTIPALRGVESKIHMPRKLMIFGGCILFALAYISF